MTSASAAHPIRRNIQLIIMIGPFLHRPGRRGRQLRWKLLTSCSTQTFLERLAVTALPPTTTVGINKAIAAGLAGAASTIIIFVINRYSQPPLPAEIGQAIQTLLTIAGVYFVPHGGEA